MTLSRPATGVVGSISSSGGTATLGREHGGRRCQSGLVAPWSSHLPNEQAALLHICSEQMRRRTDFSVKMANPSGQVGGGYWVRRSR